MAAFLLMLFIMISAGFCDEYAERCVLFAGKCVEHCPTNMHPYHTRCDVDTISQRTCDDPYSYTLGYTCGWSRCDCDGELLLDERSHACITYSACLSEFKGKLKGRRKQGLYKMSKKIRLPEKEEFPYREK